jgi:sugar lactone lactonase YvrE
MPWNVLERKIGSKPIFDKKPRYIAGALVALFVLATMCLFSTPASAQAKPAIVVNQFSWLGTISGGGFLAGQSPTGGSFAVNQNGDVIVSNTYNGHVYLYNGKTGAVTTLSSSFSNPGGVTVDSQNNIYISHLYNSIIYKIPYVNGSYVAVTDPSATPYPANCAGNDTVECQFAKPATGNARAMAFDAAGNFYMVTTPSSTGASAIYKCAVASLPNCTGTSIYSDANTIGSIAIDPWGNLFYTDAIFTSLSNQASTNSALNELTYSGGVYSSTPIVLETYTDASPGNYDDSLGAVGTDANGTVYYATQYNGILALPNNHGSINTSNVYGVSKQGGKALTLDSKGNIYVVAYNGSTDAVGKTLMNNLVIPSSPVGTASTASITVMMNDIGCSSTPTLSVSAKENGVALNGTSGEFIGVSTGSCAGQAGGSDLAATITFTPTNVGERSAVLTVTDSNGGSGTATVTGTGQGPLVTLSPGVTTSYAAGFNSPSSISVDGTGNLFVADSGAHSLFEIASGSTTPAAIGTGFTAPSGTAFDAAGNLYVADSANNQIIEIPNVGGSLVPASQVTLVSNAVTFAGTALNNPNGLAVGPGGTLYIADTGNNRVVAYVLGSGAVPGSTGVRALALNSPMGIALDASGNLYVANMGAGNVLVYSGETVTTLTPAGVTTPVGVAVEPSGSVLVADKSTGTIVRVPNEAGTLTSADAVVVATNPKSASGVALDIAGNLYTTDATGAAAYAVQQTASAINFGKVLAGASSAPVTLYVENAGNTALSAATPILSVVPSGQFTLVAGSPNGCTDGSTINPGLACEFSGQFSSTASASGPYSDTSLVNSNALNMASATITLSGSVEAPQSITFPALATPITYSTTPITLAATASSGLTVAFSVVSGPGTISGNTLTITGAGTVVVAADQAGNSTFLAAPQVTQSIVVNQASQAITFTPLTTPISYSAAPIALSATADSGLPVTFSIVSGPGSVSGSTLTITGVGTVVVAANQAGNTDYAAATQVTQSIVVNQASQAITFATLATPISYSTTPIALSATANSGLSVAFSVVSGPGTVSGSTLTITGVGTLVVAANQAGNANYAAATQVTQSIAVNQASQTITFTAPTTPVTYGAAAITLSATASSGLPVAFSVVSGPGTVSGGKLTVTGVGTVVVAANQAGNANYAAATQVTHSVVVSVIGTVATPIFTPAAGTYTSVQSVTISSATTGAVIYYTTDGTTPSTSSTVYASAISVGASETIQAIAVAPGYTNSTVASAAYTVNIVPSFTIAVNPAALTVTTGTSGTFNLTVTPQNGFNSAVTFACSGMPAGATCAFNPATVTPTTGAASTTVTITSSSTTAAVRHNSNPLFPEATFALALCFFGFRKRRSVQIMLVLVVTAIGLGMLSGCGGSSKQPTTSTVTVTATSGTIQQTATLSLTMQ